MNFRKMKHTRLSFSHTHTSNTHARKKLKKISSYSALFKHFSYIYKIKEETKQKFIAVKKKQ